MAGDVLAFVRQVGAGPAFLIGNSLAGGAVAYAAAVESAAVPGLVLLSPFVRDVPQTFAQRLRVRAVTLPLVGPRLWTTLQALRIANAYVIGAIRVEAGELRAELEGGMDKAEWQTSNGPYMHRMIATGRYPNLARVVREATNPSADDEFDRGLDRVLDGIAAHLPR